MDTIQHFFELINKRKNIFIALPDNPSGDVFFSALALKGLLKSTKPDAQIEILCKKLGSFAESKFINEIQKETNLFKEWELDLNISESKIKSIRYEKTDKNLRIIFTPEKPQSQMGKYTFSHLAKDNLAISLGIREKELLLNLFGDLDGLSLVNIDNSENGISPCSLNIIKEQDSIACTIYQLFNNEINNKKIDRDIFTLLLSAIVSATNQFRDSSLTNSKLLKAAAVLLEKGANLEKAFSSLDLNYQTKEITKQQKAHSEITEMYSWI